MYWMHHAVRAHDNPALDTALTLGNHFGLPVVVYQGLAGHHKYNSDRHHTFIMEGARDVQQEFDRKRVRYIFHLSPVPGESSPLHGLTNLAALTISEDFPAPPFPTWSLQLAQKSNSAFWVVDSHCIAPMQLISKRYNRAYAFRNATEQLHEDRLESEWSDVIPEIAPYEKDLGIQSITLSKHNIADLCQTCLIDHSIAPIPHTVGGSQAGYARWRRFKKEGLSTYHRHRNNPTPPSSKGVSRLSPYLHHGHISPFRIAREAAYTKTQGAKKFLDEMLVWRELSFNLCFHSSNLTSFAILPAWAQDTLGKHKSDDRNIIYSWETLARGKTDDLLWNLAQRSLLSHGELHNNVRMTWGKALLNWTATPQDALDLLFELNNRYALDGSDPNSYGGILWCLGLFDRPFSPELSISGSVRPRPTSQHMKRINMDAYKAHVSRSTRSDTLSVGIIGAGMAGLMAARILQDHNVEAHIYEKSRGPGGRMSSRRIDDYSIDHGAQYFTARHEIFQRYVESWTQDGIAAEWHGRLGVINKAGHIEYKPVSTSRFVGVPRMSAITRHLSNDLHIEYNTRVERVKRAGEKWVLHDENGVISEHHEGLIITTPPEQATPFLHEIPALENTVRTVEMQPCWAVLLTFDQPLAIDLDGIFFNDFPLSWASRNNSKPARISKESWVLHGSPSWSLEHLENSPNFIAKVLTECFFKAIGHIPIDPIFAKAHRWRYAIAKNPLDTGFLWNESSRIAICGDWCSMSRVEGAFLSGIAGASAILRATSTIPQTSPGQQLDAFKA